LNPNSAAALPLMLPITLSHAALLVAVTGNRSRP
jgi:hypothetical protein